MLDDTYDLCYSSDSVLAEYIEEFSKTGVLSDIVDVVLKGEDYE